MVGIAFFFPLVWLTFMASSMNNIKLSHAFDLTEEELSLNNCTSRNIGSCFDIDGRPVCNSASVTWGYGFRWGCNCDSECREYGDCCFDYLEACHNASEIDESLTTMDTNPIYGCIQVDQSSDFGVWMINRCAQKWNDEVIRRKCETTTPLGFAVENIPVTGSGRTETYRNVYCALCNGIDESSVVSWQVRATFADEYSFVWNLFEHSDARSIHKAVTLIRNGKLTANISVHDITQKQPRNCVPFIETCNPSFEGTTADYIKKACRSYISVVSGFSFASVNTSDDFLCDLCEGSVDSGKHYNYFKNPHCAMCNGYTVSSCIKVDLPEGASYTPFPIRLLFDITRSGGVTMLGETLAQMFESETNFACSSEEIFDLNTLSCLPLRTQFQSMIHKSETSNETVQAPHNMSKEFLHTSEHQNLTCSSPTFISLYDSAYRLDNDTLFYKVGNDWLQTRVFEISSNRSLAKICAQHYLLFNPFDGFQAWLSIFCSSLSVLCLVTRIIIYCVNPQMHTFPGKLLLNLVIAILLAQVLYLSSMGLNEIPLICFALAVALHYSWLANFSWMAVVSFDLCRTFRSVNKTLNVSQSVRRLAVYCLLGWLLPGCLVCTAVFLQISKTTEFNAGYGENSICWIRNPLALLIFFITPVGIIVLFNTVCFILTFMSLYRGSAKAAGNGGQSGWKALLIPCVKAFVIMGVTWNLALLEAFIDNYVLSVIFITVNSLQGTLIFLFLTVNIGSIREKFKRRISPEQKAEI
ncbi:uncharacterized protein [Ptychodera flava]|uniref:uncharacterized protein n=1 Tax=Ptychodera flava TaxID=63121 RepID=UPI00396A849C